MLSLQQLLVQLVIGTMAFGGVACLCPVAAEATAAPSAVHSHHQHDSPSADGGTQQADCGHDDCEEACERSVAVASKVPGGTSGKTPFQPDHTGILPQGIPVLAPAVHDVVQISAPRQRIALAQESPVQRYDRLLD